MSFVAARLSFPQAPDDPLVWLGVMRRSSLRRALTRPGVQLFYAGLAFRS